MATPFTSFVVKQAFGIAALNAGINAAYTFYLWRPLTPLTLFGEHGVGIDLSTTPAVIGFLSTILGTASLRKQLTDGRVTVGALLRAPALLHFLPTGVAVRSALIALVCGLLLGAPLYAALRMNASALLSLGEAIGAKVAITIVYSLMIVPAVIAAALADTQRRGRSVATV